MSTKIYNGFRMKNISGNEMVAFANELREKIRPEINKKFCEGLTKVCRKLISEAILYNTKFDGTNEFAKTIEKEFIHKWFYTAFTNSRILYDNDKIIHELEWPFIGGVINLAVNAYKSDTLNTDRVSCYNDIRSNIAFCKGDDNHLLFITYGNVFTDYLYELIKNKDKFIEKYEIEEYGYWNNTDRPEEITIKEWEKRESDWNKALPGPGITARCGLCTCNIINDDDLFSFTRMCDDGRMKMFLGQFPNIDDIIYDRAKSIVIDNYIFKDPEYDHSLTSSWALAEKYSSLLKNGDPTMNEKVNELCSKIKDQIPDCSKEDILSESIIAFIPRYIIWRNRMNLKKNQEKNKED